MIMRQLAPICLLSLLACTTVQPPELAVDVEALLVRDGLVDEDVMVDGELEPGSRKLVSATRVELDGAPPRELILQIHSTFGLPAEQLWIYDVRDVHDPRPLLISPLFKPYEERRADGVGWRDYVPRWWAEDLDQDGKAELIITVGSGQGASARLYVLGWGEDARGVGLVDRVWRAPMGEEIFIVDVNGDGRREIVVILKHPTPQLVALHKDERGVWREMAGDVKAWLPRVLDALIAQRQTTLSVAWPPLRALLREHGTRPRDAAALQAALAARLKEAVDARSQQALYEAMAWGGHAAAYDVLLSALGGEQTQELIVALLFELDDQLKQTRGRAALLAGLKDGLSGVSELRLRTVGALLREMEARGDDVAVAQVAAAIDDEARGFYYRRNLISVALPYLAGQQAVLWRLRGELRASFLEQLVYRLRSPSPPEMERWRAVLDVAQVRALMADPQTRATGMRLGLHMEPPRSKEVFALYDTLVSREERVAVIEAATGRVAPPPELLLRWRAHTEERQQRAGADSWLVRDQVEERAALNVWVMQSQDSAFLLKWLEQADQRALFSLGSALDMPVCVKHERADCALAHELHMAPAPVCAKGPAEGCKRGVLLDRLPELFELLASRVRDEDRWVRRAALMVLSVMPYNPAGALLMEIAHHSPEQEHRSDASFWLYHFKGRSLEPGYMVEPRDEDAAPDDLSRRATIVKLDGAQAQRLVDRASASVSPDDRRAWELRGESLSALLTAAPQVCPANMAGLEALMTDASGSCLDQQDAAAVVALCAPGSLPRLASDAVLALCEGEVLTKALALVGLYGAWADVAALRALSEDPRSRKLREHAHRAQERLRVVVHERAGGQR